jgi:hypothetical protein
MKKNPGSFQEGKKIQEAFQEEFQERVQALGVPQLIDTIMLYAQTIISLVISLTQNPSLLHNPTKC